MTLCIKEVRAAHFTVTMNLHNFLNELIAFKTDVIDIVFKRGDEPSKHQLLLCYKRWESDGTVSDASIALKIYAASWIVEYDKGVLGVVSDEDFTKYFSKP